MKKVGIITMHKVLNYGSVLQAYATQDIVEYLGFKSEIIDYQYPNQWQFQRGTPYHPFTLKNRIAKFLGLKSMWRKMKKMEYFISSNMHLSRPYNSPESLKKNPPQYDIYLTGSDQVWNPFHAKGDPSFMLDFTDNGKKISYASSFAISSLPEEYKSSYKNLLSRYDSISVREKGGQSIIELLLGKKVPVVLDPTLLLNAEEWKKVASHQPICPKIKGKYILVYMLKYATDPTPIIYDLLEKLQKETGYSIISLGKLDSTNKIKDYIILDDAGIYDFLHLFANASYVVTSSFHGTAFAVNFGIPLYSIVGNIGDDRQSTLLRDLEIPQCIIDIKSNISKIPSGVYNESDIQLKLNELRVKSIEFLKETLK